MLLPALNKARESARQAACTGNLKQLGLALKMYSQSWNDNFVDIGEAKTAADTYKWWEVLRSEQKLDKKLFVCPSSSGRITPTGTDDAFTDGDNISYAYMTKIAAKGNAFTEKDGTDSALAGDGAITTGNVWNHENNGRLLFSDGSVQMKAGASWYVQYISNEEGDAAKLIYFAE